MGARIIIIVIDMYTFMYLSAVNLHKIKAYICDRILENLPSTHETNKIITNISLMLK